MSWQVHFLIVAVGVPLSVLFRWVTGQPVTGSYVLERTLVFALVVLVMVLIARRDARRSTPPGRGWAWAAVLIFGPMTAVWLWRTLVALTTHRVLVGLNPEAHLEWAQNPWGFAAALALGVVGAAMFGLLFAVNLMELLKGRGPRY